MADRVIVQNSTPVVDVTIDGVTTPGVAMEGTFIVDTRQLSIAVIPTISAGAYMPGDALGGKLTFENVVGEEDGGGITIDSIIFTSQDRVHPDIDLVMFTTDFAATANNAEFDPSDADLPNIFAVIKSGDWAQFKNAEVSSRAGLGYNGVLVGQHAYGQMVIRSAVSFTGTDHISVRIGVRQD
jgi:hypothetical protein